MGYVDDVIDPASTRQRVAAAFEMMAAKRESRPKKKHGNIPVSYTHLDVYKRQVRHRSVGIDEVEPLRQAATRHKTAAEAVRGQRRQNSCP